MNEQEKIAELFLINQGYTEICFEPLGKSKPPDFSVNKSIGIEVRKLNKKVIVGQKIVDIEELNHKANERLGILFSKCEMPTHPNSYYVSISYKRPLKLKSDFSIKLNESLSEAVLLENLERDFYLTKSFKYRLFRTKKMKQTFEIAAWSDLDAGGCVQEDRYFAITQAIIEKQKKLKTVCGQFNELWLILVDTIFSRIDETTKQDLAHFPKIESIFHKVILISNRNPNAWIELY